MSVAIHIENVVKKYENQTVIDGLSLEIKKRRTVYSSWPFWLWKNDITTHDYRL